MLKQEKIKAEPKPEFFRQNYIVHCIEGGLYMGGLTFISSSVVLPAIVKSLGGPTWLISLMPILMLIGFLFPPLFTAHRIERLHWLKPLVVINGFFQRIPYLIAGIVLIFFASKYPTAALICVALTPLISGMIGGVSVTAWQTLVAKTIPANKLSSVWAIRNIITAVIGIFAGGAIAHVLGSFPGIKGYGILHMIAFGFLAASFMVLVFLRETKADETSQNKPITLIDNLSGIPELIRTDPLFVKFLAFRMMMSGIFIMTPFLAIHTLQVLNKPESYLGILVSFQMIGGISGNMMAGLLGDKKGSKIVVQIGAVLFAISSFWAAIASSGTEFLIIFFLYGAAFFFYNVGTTTLAIEISKPNKKPTYLAIFAAAGMISALSASAMSTSTKVIFDRFDISAYLAGIFIIGALSVTFFIQDPRNNKDRIIND